MVLDFLALGFGFEAEYFIADGFMSIGADFGMGSIFYNEIVDVLKVSSRGYTNAPTSQGYQGTVQFKNLGSDNKAYKAVPLFRFQTKLNCYLTPRDFHFRPFFSLGIGIGAVSQGIDALTFDYRETFLSVDQEQVYDTYAYSNNVTYRNHPSNLFFWFDRGQL